MQIDLYPQNTSKVFLVDYFVYVPNCTQRKIYSFLTFANSRKDAEKQVRDVERGSKVTIVKIKTFDNVTVEEQQDSEYAY